VQRTGGAPLVRTILAVDEEQQSMTFAGDLPQGGIARLMRANTDKLVGSAALAAEQAGERGAAAPHGEPERHPTAAHPGLVVSVSCVGRRLVLGERTEEEVEAVADSSAPGSAHVGFYSYGEFSPLISGGASELHNQTMTVTAFGEV
jgi:hypothetical protein